MLIDCVCKCVSVCLCMCVCMHEREREREFLICIPILPRPKMPTVLLASSCPHSHRVLHVPQPPLQCGTTCSTPIHNRVYTISVYLTIVLVCLCLTLCYTHVLWALVHKVAPP